MLCTQRPAFASHNSSNSDVNKFFEDCKHPPTLDLFTSEDGLDVQEALVRIHLCLLLECELVDVQHTVVIFFGAKFSRFTGIVHFAFSILTASLSAHIRQHIFWHASRCRISWNERPQINTRFKYKLGGLL